MPSCCHLNLLWFLLSDAGTQKEVGGSLPPNRNRGRALEGGRRLPVTRLPPGKVQRRPPVAATRPTPGRSARAPEGAADAAAPAAGEVTNGANQYAMDEGRDAEI